MSRGGIWTSVNRKKKLMDLCLESRGIISPPFSNWCIEPYIWIYLSLSLALSISSHSPIFTLVRNTLNSCIYKRICIYRYIVLDVCLLISASISYCLTLVRFRHPPQSYRWTSPKIRSVTSLTNFDFSEIVCKTYRNYMISSCYWSNRFHFVSNCGLEDSNWTCKYQASLSLCKYYKWPLTNDIVVDEL